MRDVLLLLVMAVAVPACLVNPYYGVLMWYWVSYLNPHRFTYGFTYNLPVALMVAAPTLIGAVFAKKSLRSLLTWEGVLLIALWMWYTITYIHAKSIPMFVGHMKEADYEMSHISKIFLMTIVMILFITTRARLHGVMLMSSCSLGFLAFKDALFGVRTEGEYRVFGPPDSFLTDNNAFGLAINVSLPILFFLARREERRWLRMILYLFFACGIVTVLLTYSRGGLVGLIIVLSAIMLRTRHKVLAAGAVVIALMVIVAIAPPAWMDRMGNFAHGNLDATANQRLVSWGTAWNFSHDFPITGGSFEALPDVYIYQRYQPRPLPDGLTSSGPHSIYFQLLADQGFVGVALFLLLIGSCFWTLVRIRRISRRVPQVAWLADYTLMVEAAIMGFMASGAFLGFVYLDLIYQMIGTTVVLKVLLRRELQALSSAPQEETHVPVSLEEVSATA